MTASSSFSFTAGSAGWGHYPSFLIGSAGWGP